MRVVSAAAFDVSMPVSFLKCSTYFLLIDFYKIMIKVIVVTSEGEFQLSVVKPNPTNYLPIRLLSQSQTVAKPKPKPTPK